MDEDMILPEGFDGTPTAEPEAETMETPDTEFNESIDTDAEDTTPADVQSESEESVTQPQTIKVKFNHQEMELSADEAATLAQKGMAFDKAVERARAEAAQQARDAVIAEMGMTWNGQPVTTEAEYRQALQEQELINKYKDRDLPEEVIKELMESRRDREERQQEKQAKAEAEKEQSAFNELFQYFEEANGRRFDAKQDQLPQEVLDAIQNKQWDSLLSTYIRNHNKELRNQLMIAKQNQANTKKAPVGSVTAGGGVKTDPEDLFMQGFNSI